MTKDVLIFLGQSNMQGETEKITETEPVKDAVEYRYLSGSFVELKNPVGEDIGPGMVPSFQYGIPNPPGNWHEMTLLASAAYGRNSLIPECVRAYIRETGHKVVAVSACKGSTRADMWCPGNPHHDALVTKVKAAMKKITDSGDEIGHVYSLWLQGESDALAKISTEEYYKNLKTVKDSLISELGIDKFGIIKVGVFFSIVNWFDLPYEERKGCDDAIRDAQERLCGTDDDCLMVTRATARLLEDPENCNPNVGGHFGAVGLEVLGNIAGTNLGCFVNGQPYKFD